MMKIKNSQLIDLIELLEKVELKPRASRVRTRLNKLFYSKVQDLQSDEIALLERFGKRDEKGVLIQNQGVYSLIETTALEYHQEKGALLAEAASINVDELNDKLGMLIEELDNSDMKFSGKDAVALDLLIAALEDEIRATN